MNIVRSLFASVFFALATVLGVIGFLLSRIFDFALLPLSALLALCIFTYKSLSDDKAQAPAAKNKVGVSDVEPGTPVAVRRPDDDKK